MAAQKFKKDQKVFAKVRGYPPWPARINAVMDETPNRQKYQVYFYGTHETGTCKLDELYDYVETKAKYGKGVKRKHFTEAINEIEQELTVSANNNSSNSLPLQEPTNDSVTAAPPVAAAVPSATPTLENDSDDEGNLVIDETPAHNKERAKSDNTKPAAAAAASLKRKHSADTPEMAPVGEVTSRSGRKIKPKKFLDEPAEFTSPVITKAAKQRGGTAIAAAAAAAQVKESIISNDDNPNGKVIHEDVSTTNGDRVELHWESKQNLQELINRAEQSELPKNVKKDFKKSVKKKAEELRPQQLQQHSCADNESLELLKTEVQLLDADCRIKSSLSLTAANCEDCLRAMDEILELKLTPVMLKKHPEVVDTVKKLKKYVGNASQWRLSHEDEACFVENAKKIRSKADTMYNKFKSLFAVPNGKSFYEVYSSEVETFQQKTHNMSVNEIYSTVKEEMIEN